MNHDEPDYKRIFLAIFLAATVLIFWQVKIEWPRRQALAHLNAAVTQQHNEEAAKHVESIPARETEAEENPSLSREQRLAGSPRIAIDSDKLRGSIALKGARFDDLTLARYHVTLDKDSPEVTLFSPNGDDQAWFTQIGWLASGKTNVPDQNTLWQADKKTLLPGQTVNLKWNNGEGVAFMLAVSLDENYMFSIAQRVENHSGHTIAVLPYAYINRAYDIPKQAAFLHEGPLGVMDGALNESTYKELRDKGNMTYDTSSGWFGITDKYWLAALIPSGNHEKITFSHYSKGKTDRYQVDYLGDALSVADGASADDNVRLFAGAKELKLLDHYASGTIDHQPPIPLFDRALDFGWFYFLAKPMCMVVNFLYTTTGNFGVALLLFIILVKLFMYPLANKSFKSMAQMRELQPEMVKIRERYADDQIAMHKAMRELYKREKVNPAAGCLPVLIQILVFLALFRGLNVTIEMRHAPFFGWIKDLSAPDPSNLFTAFGLVPWNTPHWLHLGLLPMLYCITMVIQTSQQPTPPDPVQAKMMKWMPYFFLFVFDNMASGFVLYWTWSNLLSIFQQRLITKRHGDKTEQKKMVAGHES